MTHPVEKLIPLLKRWDHGVHSQHLATEIVKALGLTEERRTRNAYDEAVDEHSWVTPWEPYHHDPDEASHPAPLPPEDVECCASGRCEVCTPGYVWGTS